MSVLLRTLFPSVLTKIKTKEKILFLTFDDGPIETITPAVLDILKTYHAKATFFCIGENVAKNKDVYERILNAGHATGNHTYNHLNGWKTKTKEYVANVLQCANVLSIKTETENSKPLFRPPYGRITLAQYLALKNKYTVVMWDVLSRDWKQNLSGEDCFTMIQQKASAGSIIVFHDSLKAKDRMLPALIRTLDYFSEQGFEFKKL